MYSPTHVHRAQIYRTARRLSDFSLGTSRCSHPVAGGREPGITADAWARTAESRNWSLVLKFCDRDGRRHSILATRDQIADGASFFALLADLGFPVPISPIERDRLQRELLVANPDRRILLVGRSGWRGPQFPARDQDGWPWRRAVDAGRRYRQGDRPNSASRHPGRVESPGRLPVLGQPLFCCNHVLRLGGAALESRTSKDGGSLFSHAQHGDNVGLAGLHRQSFRERGRLLAGTGDVAATSRWRTQKRWPGTPTCPSFWISRIKSAPPNSAAKVRWAISTRWRSHSPAQTRCRIRPSSSVPVRADWSSPEERPDTRQTSLIKIRLPTSTPRIFRRISRAQSDDKTRIFVEQLRQNTETYYGTAGRTFVQRLVSEVVENRTNLIARINRDIDWFVDISGFDPADESLFERAKLFGLAYAAGRLAIRYGVVPWYYGLVRQSLHRCYRRTPNSPSAQDNPIVSAAAKVLRRLRRVDGIVDISSKADTVDPDRAAGARVLATDHSDGSLLLAVRPEFFRSIIGRHVAAPAVARYLEEQGILVGRPNGRRTREIRIPGSDKRRDYYCLRLDRIRPRKDRRRRGKPD